MTTLAENLVLLLTAPGRRLRLYAVNPTASGEPVLDTAMAALDASGRGRCAVERLTTRTREAVLDRLLQPEPVRRGPRPGDGVRNMVLAAAFSAAVGSVRS